MSTVSFKCPHCDGELLFDAETQRYKCKYCDSDFSLDEIKREESADSDTSDAAGIYTCPSCGAEIVAGATTAASFCYFCRNPIVFSRQVEGEFHPDRIIPFAIDRDRAVELFLEYVGKKRFIPKGFFTKESIEEMSGVYFPYWLFEGSADGELTMEGSKVRQWISGDIIYTETSIFRIERAGAADFRNLIKNAWEKAQIKLAEGVLPYDLSETKEFQMGYLSGFFAEKRDLEVEDIKEEVQGELSEYMKKLLKSTAAGYDSVRILSGSSHIVSEKWSYLLLPVWVITYHGRDGKVYHYSMNGVNGRVHGELPVGRGRVAALSIILGAVCAVLMWLMFFSYNVF